MNSLTCRFLLSVCFAFTFGLPCSAETTILIVRHAEKKSGDGNVALAEEGLVRARELAQFSKSLRVSSVYSTDTLRSRLTAQPSVSTSAIKIYQQPTRDWCNQVLLENDGKVVLIVGHSNTVPMLSLIHI